MRADLEIDVKLAIYGMIAETTRAPSRRALALRLGVEEPVVAEALSRLREKKLVYLGRESGEIVMAPPFSAVPTPFGVRIEGRTYYANCVWDAYGVAAALGKDAEIDASCGCCGEPTPMGVRDGSPVALPGLAHFAVPARHWWDDLTYT